MAFACAETRGVSWLAVFWDECTDQDASRIIRLKLALLTRLGLQHY